MKTFLGWLFTETVTKVVDGQGQPLVVWHGSKNGAFDKFDKNYIGQNDDGWYGRGFYFSPSRQEAEEYGPARPFYLNIANPFPMPSSGHLDHESLHDLRDRLASLKGIPENRPIHRTNREIPPGYYLDEEEVDNPYFDRSMPVRGANRPTWKMYQVSPKPELYGTDKEIYGPSRMSALHAVIDFNDQIERDEQIGLGWTFGFLKEVMRRDQLVDILKLNGYDGIFIYDPDDGHVKEYMAFEPEQITPV